MTMLPEKTGKKLGLVIDLDTCVGCQACVTSCKEWNTGGYSAPLSDIDPYGADPDGAWLNRVHTYEAGDGMQGQTVHFPRSCLHCEEPECVTVCPTGASYKREEDGIVLIDQKRCQGYRKCVEACPYKKAMYRTTTGTSEKCVGCYPRIEGKDPVISPNGEPCETRCMTSCPGRIRLQGLVSIDDNGQWVKDRWSPLY